MQPADQRADVPPQQSPDSPREPLLPYNGLALDRAAGRRSDEAWLRGVARRPGSRLLALWRDKCLVDASGREPVTIPMADPGALLGPAAGAVAGAGAESVAEGGAGTGDGRAPVFLGLDGEAGVFAVDLSDVGETAATRLAGASAAVDTRQLFAGLDGQRAAALAYARGLLRWHRDQRFCGTCGAPSRPGEGGHLRTCAGPGCGRLHFPRIEPAVIVVVEAPGAPTRCLLGRHQGAEAGAFALSAMRARRPGRTRRASWSASGPGRSATRSPSTMTSSSKPAGSPAPRWPRTGRPGRAPTAIRSVRTCWMAG